MNKYEEKVIELASDDAMIYELVREEISSTKGQIIDFMLEGLVAFVAALKNLKKRNTYYLVMNEKKSELIRIKRNLDTSLTDVTSAIQAAANQHSFTFEGKKYKLHQKSGNRVKMKERPGIKLRCFMQLRQSADLNQYHIGKAQVEWSLNVALNP